jgi:hypothetical protein
LQKTTAHNCFCKSHSSTKHTLSSLTNFSQRLICRTPVTKGRLKLV